MKNIENFPLEEEGVNSRRSCRWPDTMMSESNLLLILLGSPHCVYMQRNVSIQELSLLTSRSPLEIAHTPFLDCLSASGANGLLDCGNDSEFMSLLTTLASTWSSDQQSGVFTSIASASEGDMIRQILDDAICELNLGCRVKIVHFIPDFQERDADGTFIAQVDSLKEEVDYLENITERCNHQSG